MREVSHDSRCQAELSSADSIEMSLNYLKHPRKVPEQPQAGLKLGHGRKFPTGNDDHSSIGIRH